MNLYQNACILVRKQQHGSGNDVFSYHRKYKILIEASCTNNIRTEEKFFAAATFEDSRINFFSE